MTQMPHMPREASVAEAQAALADAGWREVGVGDWSWVMADPEDRVAIRLTPFDPAYRLHAEAVLAGLAAYGGTRRRFETKGVARGVTVVDDYAHNPGKVEAVVRTAREIAGERRLLVVFQPHLYSRTRDFATAFAAGLEPADEVLLLDIYAAREDPVEGVTSALIADPLSAAGTAVRVLPANEAVRRVADAATEGDLVLTVGAGDVTELGPRILHALDTPGD